MEMAAIVYELSLFHYIYQNRHGNNELNNSKTIG